MYRTLPTTMWVASFSNFAFGVAAFHAYAADAINIANKKAPKPASAKVDVCDDIRDMGRSCYSRELPGVIREPHGV
jgi:hypothetical protein